MISLWIVLPSSACFSRADGVGAGAHLPPRFNTEGAKNHGAPRRSIYIALRAKRLKLPNVANVAARLLPPETFVPLRGPSCSPCLKRQAKQHGHRAFRTGTSCR